MLNRWLQKIRDRVPGGEENRDDAAQAAAGTAAETSAASPMEATTGGAGTDPGSTPAEPTAPAAAPKPPFVPPRLPNWQPGDVVLENYRIDAVISGDAAAGQAFRCRHLAWRVPLVLEIPPAKLLQSPAELKKCLKRAETRVKTGLHPNVAASYNLRFHQRLPVMISEYVEGEDLGRWLAEQRCRNPRIALSLAIQLCHGMECCHALGLRHGDLKPEKIRINPHSLLKVGGFGLAPPSAASPAGTDDDDIQAAGRCLQQMFKSGGESHFELPAALHKALARCLHPDPDRRYRDFTDLRHDLNLAYRELFKLPCPYHEPPLLDQRAEVLNNQAVFLLEEGKQREAARKLHKSLEINDTLPTAIYNELLLRWRLEGTAPARILRRIEANRQPGRHGEDQKLLPKLAKAAKLNITGLKSDFAQDQEAGPEFQLVPPPRRLAVYRRGAQRRQWEEKIHHHLVNRRYQGCFEDLLKAWRPEGFRKDRFFNRIYEELLLVRQKLLPIQGQRFMALTGHRAPVRALCCIPDSRRIASAGLDGRLLIHNLHHGSRPETTENLELPITTLTVDPKGKHLAVGTQGGGVHLLSSRTGKVLGQEQSHRAPVTALAFNHDGKLLASGDEEGHIIVRRLATGREDGVTLADSGAITALLYPDQELELLSGSEDGQLRHWKSRLRDCTATIAAHAGAIYAAGAGPDGQQLISAGADRRVKVWPRHGETPLHTLKGHGDRIRTVLGLADGRCLASAGDDDLINIWAVKSGEKLFSLDGRGGGIHSLAPGPRPHTLLAGRADGTINVWQLIYQLDFDLI